MKKLMIIDDDETSEFCLRSILSNHFPDISISSFENGKVALEYIISKDRIEDLPDFILLDINMPVMDGWGFMEAISANIKSLKKVPRIVMMSSSISKTDLTRAIDLPHVQRFITKPISVQHLSSLF